MLPTSCEATGVQRLLPQPANTHEASWLPGMHVPISAKDMSTMHQAV